MCFAALVTMIFSLISGSDRVFQEPRATMNDSRDQKGWLDRIRRDQRERVALGSPDVLLFGLVMSGSNGCGPLCPFCHRVSYCVSVVAVTWFHTVDKSCRIL
jgi:hypothetical protein